MVPKKTKELVKLTAEQTGQDEELVRDLVSFYWGEVRKSLVELKSHNIFVESLGTFRAKSWKVEELIVLFNKYLEHGDYSTFNKWPIKKKLEDNLEKVVKLKNSISEEAERKKQVKIKRNENNSKNNS